MSKSQVIRLQLRSAYLDTLCEDDYILILPKTDEELRAVRDQLGVKTFSECEITQMNSPLRVLEKMDYADDVSLMNDIGWAVEKALNEDKEGSNLLVVLEAFGKEGPQQLKERIEHRHCYMLLSQDNSEEGYGKWCFSQRPALLSADLAPYIDFKKNGAAMLQQHPAYSTSEGWLIPEPGSFKIYMPLACKTEDGIELDAEDMAEYEQEIADRITFDIGTYLPANGFIERSRLPDTIKKQVDSVYPTVETHGGELWGCLRIYKRGWITQADLDALSGEWKNELEHGWGEHFRQEDIRVVGGRLYVDFCKENEDYRFFSEKEIREMDRSHWLDHSAQALT